MGEGTIEGEETLTFRVAELQRATSLIHVNAYIVSSWYGYDVAFEAGLPSLFQTLLESRGRFRVAFVWDQAGKVDGPVPYIDETYSVSDAVKATERMLMNASRSGDNDSSFTTLDAAISANSSWLFEDVGWADSRLSLVAIDDDYEQSGGTWSNYLARARKWKADPEDVVFHAIAGDMHGGCGVADPFMGYHEAVLAAGGEFLSVSATDWSSHMSRLALAMLDSSTVFPLDGTPLVSSIEVSLDGQPMVHGWSYDRKINAVIFDEGALGWGEAEVDVHYLYSMSCD